MVEVIFWLSVGSILYTYFGYPFLLIALSYMKGKSVHVERITPLVTLIVTVHNEEGVIREKIRNCLLLDYPQDKLEIVVASDCSTDRTIQIVKEFANGGVKLVELTQRAGKTRAQNAAVEIAKGDILVFSDATIMLKKDSLQKLVRNFYDEAVGFVSGEDKWVSPTVHGSAQGQGMYVKYEMMIRRLESRVNSLVCASGCFYAIRRRLYSKLPKEIIDDFAIPLSVVESGYRGISEPEAIAVVKMPSAPKYELARRKRMTVGGLAALTYKKHLLNPLKYGFFSVQLLSHKLLRWLVPFFLLITLITSFLLYNIHLFYRVVFALQMVFSIFAIIGYFLKGKEHKIRIFNIPFYFYSANIAILRAWFEYLLGNREVIWEPSRR